MAEFASKGVGTAGLTTGIIGTALGALNSGILGGNGVLGGWSNNNAAAAALGAVAGGMARGCCSEDHTVNRYELGLQQEIAAKDAQIALRDANTYGDQKMLEMYKYFDGQLKNIRDTLCAQAVHNQRTEDSFVVARQDIAAVRSDLSKDIQMEAERRCCGDNSIVTYVNATFYPKAVADVTTGTTTTTQTLYNPLPKCGHDCGC